jgi:hypothetical protein
MSATDTDVMTSDEHPDLVAPRRTRVDPPHQLADAGEPPLGADEASAQSETLAPAAISEEHVPLEVHVALEVEEPTEAMIAAVAGEDLDVRREQLQLQVAQLAGHLRERLREVDRREATLNARASELESDLRTSRMWLRERELEFQERESDLRRNIEELEERLAMRGSEVQASAYGADARRAELDNREREIQVREDDLRQRRFESDRQAAAFCHAQQFWQQQRQRQEQDLAQQRDQLTQEFQLITAEREEQLRAAELLLSEHAQQLDGDRTALLADRQAWEEQKTRQRQAIDELRAATEAELTDRRQKLDARQDWIERQRGALEQVRDEALRLHRQSIEMRLLAEQLWSQITGAVTPAEAAQAVAQLRLKLADQYRIEEQQLTARRDELLSLGERIAKQHGELAQLRSGLREWAAARHAEIEQQAATLVQRELALDTQQEDIRQARQSWQTDRRRYEEQIRVLTAQLRSQPVAA